MTRKRAKRILGMTIAQLVILGCMVLSFCGVMVGGYWMLNFMVASAYGPAGPLPTLGPSSTPAASPTLGPTFTPSSTPTETPIPYQALIPAGSKQFTSPDAPGMEIWFPASYVTRTSPKDKGLSLTVFDVNNEDAHIFLSLRDTTESPYLVYTTAFVADQPMHTSTLDDMLDRVFAGLMRTSILIERDNIQINGLSARKLVFDVNTTGVETGLVLYAAQIGQTIWYVGFVTPFNELNTRQPVFDQIAQTFRVLPVTPTPPPTATVPSPTSTALP